MLRLDNPSIRKILRQIDPNKKMTPNHKPNEEERKLVADYIEKALGNEKRRLLIKQMIDKMENTFPEM